MRTTDVSIHDRIEAEFENWGYFLCRHRWATTLLVLLTTAILGAWIPRLEGDFSPQSYLPAGDPSMAAYDEFREQFDRDDRILIGINAPAVFDLVFLDKLSAFHRDLKRELPFVEEVTSLINARWTRGEDDELIVEELMEALPEDEWDLAALRTRVLANPLYIDTLISEGETFTTVTIRPYTYSAREPAGDVLAGFDDGGEPPTNGGPEYLTLPESRELLEKLDELVQRYESPDFTLYVLGPAVLEAHVRAVSTRDGLTFTLLSFGIMSLVLFAFFRRLSGVVLPLTVIAMSLIATVGSMAAIGMPFSIVSQIVPTFLIAIGVCDSVHVLAIVYRRLALGDLREDAVAFALRHSGLAVVMTSLTTAGGMVSFAAAEVAPVANLGILTPIGVVLAMVYTLTLLPALLLIVPLRVERHDAGAVGTGALDRLLAGTGDLATRHPWPVLAVTLVVLLVSLGGILRVRFSHDNLGNLPKHDPIRIAAERVDREFKGTATVEVLIDTGRENGLHEPDMLNRIEMAGLRVESLGDGALRVSKATSIVDLLKEIHQALNENRLSHYILPQDRRLIAQELLLFENSGSDDLREFTGSLFRKGRITFRVSQIDAIHYLPLIERVEGVLRETLGQGVGFQVTGQTVLYSRTFVGVIRSVARSYVVTLLIITPLMVLLIGRLGRGLLCMIPNLIPVLVTLGFMGWLDIALNLSTLLVGSIVIGVAVDDTVHFMHRFNRNYETTGDVGAAVRETLLTTGSAMLVTSVVLTLSFGIYVLGYMTGLVQVGLLTAFATVIAFLADVLVAPALLKLALGGDEPLSGVMMPRSKLARHIDT